MDNLSPILKRFAQFQSDQPIDVLELKGGITNRNYKITAGGDSFVLRLGGNETRFLGIDRRNEYESSALAWKVGIAPEPVAFLEPEGYILAEFVAGSGMSADEIGTSENIQRVVQSMKAYHALDRFPGSFSPFRVAQEYTQTARSFNVRLPDNIDWILKRSHEVERAMYREPLEPRPCHNDLLNGNFIDDGTRIRILDWEYAGMGDIFFDLGNFAVQHEFSDEQDEILLKAYFGSPSDSQRAHQKLMKIMSDLREAMWSLVQMGVSKLDFDYADYGRKYFERFEDSTSSGDYQKWIREV